jgi:hypothetical protein
VSFHCGFEGLMTAPVIGLNLYALLVANFEVATGCTLTVDPKALDIRIFSGHSSLVLWCREKEE